VDPGSQTQDTETVTRRQAISNVSVLKVTIKSLVIMTVVIISVSRLKQFVTLWFTFKRSNQTMSFYWRIKFCGVLPVTTQLNTRKLGNLFTLEALLDQPLSWDSDPWLQSSSENPIILILVTKVLYFLALFLTLKG